MLSSNQVLNHHSTIIVEIKLGVFEEYFGQNVQGYGHPFLKSRLQNDNFISIFFVLLGGGIILKKIIEHLPPPLQEEILIPFVEQKGRCLSSRCGQVFWNKLNLEVFEKDEDEWFKLQNQKEEGNKFLIELNELKNDKMSQRIKKKSKKKRKQQDFSLLDMTIKKKVKK